MLKVAGVIPCFSIADTISLPDQTLDDCSKPLSFKCAELSCIHLKKLPIYWQKRTTKHFISFFL